MHWECYKKNPRTIFNYLEKKKRINNRVLGQRHGKKDKQVGLKKYSKGPFLFNYKDQ